MGFDVWENVCVISNYGVVDVTVFFNDYICSDTRIGNDGSFWDGCVISNWAIAFNKNIFLNFTIVAN